MTDKLTDAYPMPLEEEENISLPSETAELELPPFQDITEDDIFAHNIDDALSQEAKKELDYDENNLPEREYIPMPTIFEPIPEEAQKEILSKFALKKREKEDSVIKTSQRLVNQFRALSAFRDDFVAEYNEELLNASEEVLSYLPTIIGGPAVREYLDYLLAHKQQGKVFDQENIDFSITKRQGYLPSPDEDEVYKPLNRNISSENITIDNAPLVHQTEILAESLNSLKQSLSNQTEELKTAISLMGEALNRPVTISSDGTGVNVTAPVNSDQIAQSAQVQREMLETAFEKMVSMQSELFQKTVEELSKTVQTMQEQLRPAGVVRQALSSLKASQQPTKTDTPLEESTQDQKTKKASKRINKKEKEESAQLSLDNHPVETPTEKEEINLSTSSSNEELTPIETSEMTMPANATPALEKDEKEINPFEPVKKEEKLEREFSLLEELGIHDEFGLYDNIKKSKPYSLLDELEEEEMEILSEFDISKQD